MQRRLREHPGDQYDDNDHIDDAVIHIGAVVALERHRNDRRALAGKRAWVVRRGTVAVAQSGSHRTQYDQGDATGGSTSCADSGAWLTPVMV